MNNKFKIGDKVYLIQDLVSNKIIGPACCCQIVGTRAIGEYKIKLLEPFAGYNMNTEWFALEEWLNTRIKNCPEYLK